MRLKTIALALCALSTSIPAHANQNIIRSQALIPFSVNDPSSWQQIDDYVSDWQDVRSEYDCSAWTPDPTTQALGTAFVQTQLCSQDQERTVQEREQNVNTGEIRDLGSPQTESSTLSALHTRDSVGVLETWVATSPTYTDWSTIKGPYSCGDWTPSGSGYTSSGSFNQLSSTCLLDQTRNRQDREQESNTGTYRDKGAAVVENRTLNNQSSTRSYEVELSAWTNTGSVTGCTNWSPDPSTVNSGTTFTQTATNCSQNQTRSRVEKYTDNETGVLTTAVNTTESQTINASSTRTATGTKLPYSSCKYQSSVTYWIVGTNGSASIIINYKTIGTAASTATSVKIGTTTYYRGAFKENYSGTVYNIPMYEVCY